MTAPLSPPLENASIEFSRGKREPELVQMAKSRELRRRPVDSSGMQEARLCSCGGVNKLAAMHNHRYAGVSMRKIAIAVLCSLLLPLLSWAQTKVTLSPEERAFVKEDAPVLALVHVRVIDGTGAAARADQTLVITEGKIAALGDAATTKIPGGAKVLDLSGYTVIPGLVGMHDHMYYPAPGGPPLYPEHAASFPRLYLAGGVTSI